VVDAAGKEMFTEAMAEGTLEAYFTLAAQFRTREFSSALSTAKAGLGVELSAAHDRLLPRRGFQVQKK